MYTCILYKPAHTQLAINKRYVRAESFAVLPRELGNSCIATPALCLVHTCDSMPKYAAYNYVLLCYA